MMAGKAGPAPVRVPGKPAPAGDNLTPDEKREIVYRARKKEVVDLMQEKEAAQAVVKEIGERLTEARQRFKRETHIDLKDLDAIIRVSRLQRAERSEAVQNFNWMAEMEGLAPGGQMSMFGAMIDAQAKTPQPVKDALSWEMDGRTAYLANRECKPPADCPPEHQQAWMKAWHAEEERTAWAMAEHGKIVDRDPSKDRAVSAPPLSEKPDDANADADESSEACETCGGDGSILSPELSSCPGCGAEYDPPEPDDSAPETPTLN